MTKINSKVLYTAYNLTSATPEKEDVSTKLQAAADECGHTWGEDEMQETREFLGRHGTALAEAYDQGGFAPFDAVVMICQAEDEKREAARGGEA